MIDPISLIAGVVAGVVLAFVLDRVFRPPPPAAPSSLALPGSSANRNDMRSEADKARVDKRADPRLDDLLARVAEIGTVVKALAEPTAPAHLGTRSPASGAHAPAAAEPGQADDLVKVRSEIEQVRRLSNTIVSKLGAGLEELYRQLARISDLLEPEERAAPARPAVVHSAVPVALRDPAPAPERAVPGALLHRWNQLRGPDDCAAALPALNALLEPIGYRLSDGFQLIYFLLYPVDDARDRALYVLPALGKRADLYNADFFEVPRSGAAQQLVSAVQVRFLASSTPSAHDLATLMHQDGGLAALAVVRKGQLA